MWGAAGVAIDATHVVVCADRACDEPIGERPIRHDGGFEAIPIGDNLHATVFVVPQRREEGATHVGKAVRLDNDVVAPLLTWTGVPPSPTSQAQAVFAFSSDDPVARITCSLDGADPEPCLSPYVTAPLGPGEHRFEVQATDRAGNASRLEAHWVYDATAPSVIVHERPEPIGRRTDPRIVFECSEPDCTFRCEVDGGPRTGCTSPLELTDLADGNHRVVITATDAAGNHSSQALVTWRVDTLPPEVILVEFAGWEAPGIRYGRPHRVAFACNEGDCTYVCSVDGGLPLRCESPFRFQADEGDHTLRIRATDAAGNEGPWFEIAWHNAAARWRSVAAGDRHTCAVATDDHLYCWGDGTLAQLGNGSTQPTAERVRVGGPDWIQVAAGELHTCAIRFDGSLWCWGYGPAGQLGLGEGTISALEPRQVGTKRWRRVVARDGSTCGIQEDDSLWCWGSNIHGQLGAPQLQGEDAFEPALVGEGFAQVSLGSAHGCAIRLDGSLVCWGSNAEGQLGDPRHETSHAPVAVDGGPSHWRAVSAGASSTCAVGDDGRLWCWGAAWPAGTASPRPAPYLFDVSGWAGVSLHTDHGCALRESGELFCFGDDRQRAVGTGRAEPGQPPTPVGVESRWAQVATGPRHTCAVSTQGSLACWGSNDANQLGIPSSSTRFVEIAMAPGTRADHLVGGGAHVCARIEGQIHCWGSNSRGQLGIGGMAVVDQPLRIEGLSWAEAAFGVDHSCAIDAAGVLRCWGRGTQGQLGNGLSFDATTPVPVAGGATWRAVSGGFVHTCGLQTDGSLWCWGNGGGGRLGDGTGASRNFPGPVGEAIWTDLSVGYWHACGIQQDGSLWCWGANYSGALGDQTTETRAQPVRVGSATDWVEVVVGEIHTCARKADGSVWCWGDNRRGQLALPEGIERVAEPVELGPPYGGWDSLHGGPWTTCARRSQRLHCWGRNEGGMFGSGFTLDVRTPVPVAEQVQQVAIGEAYLCILGTDGRVRCAGANRNGELGIGARFAATPRTLPGPDE